MKAKQTHVFHVHAVLPDNDGIVDVFEIRAISKAAARNMVQRDFPRSRIVKVYADSELKAKQLTPTPARKKFKSPITEAFLSAAGRKPEQPTKH